MVRYHPRVNWTDAPVALTRSCRAGGVGCSCIWVSEAGGSSDSAASGATGVAAAALSLSLSSAPTTAYPVIFFSILAAMTRFLVFVFAGLGAGGHVAGGAGEDRGPPPTPSPPLWERCSSWLTLFCALACGSLCTGLFSGLL